MSENNYSTVWANGDNIQAMWNKIKAMFLSAAHDQTSMADSWRTQARNNLGLGRNTLISDLYAGRAQNDDKGNVITDTYAASMSFRTASGTTYLSIYNNAYSGTTPSPSPLSSIPINASNGLARLDVNAKIPLALIPDSIAGQLLYGGTVGATGVVALSQNAKDKWGISSLTITATNYADYDGVYFIASADFDATRNAYIYYDSSYTGDKTVRMGDWVVATTLGWVKIDNTDAVRSVSGCKDSLISPTPGITGDVIITAQRVGALDLYLPNETQEVQGKVQFDKDIWSLNGIAAYGIADLSIYGAASSGTITQIQIDGTAIQDVNGVVNLPAYPTWATLSGKPELATVATSGSYNDLTDKPNIPQGTVTSVGLTIPTGLSVSPSSITTSGTFAISLASGYIIPKTEVFDTLTAAIGNLQSSLGSAAYRDDSYFATAEEYGVSCNDITTLQSYFSSGSAKTAVKLLNPRSIWGKSFDGTADITGAMTGVTTIDSFVSFDGTNSILSVTGKITASGDIKSTSGNIEALAGGVAAFGIADLAIGAGGGAGTLTQIQINGTALTDVNGVVNITLAQGDNNGQIKIGGQNVSVHGLGSFAYISSLALSSLTGAAEVNKIETLASTGTPSGFLKRASNGTWSFDTTSYLSLAGGTMSNTNVVTNLNADLLDGVHKEGLFTAFTNDNEQASITIGGTNKKLTIDYANKALRMKQESKPNQEFTFRKSPKTIDTDSMRLDKIKGKTLVWNTMVQDNTGSTTHNGITFTRNANGTITLSGTASAMAYNNFNAVKIIAGHKYYISMGNVVSGVTFEAHLGASNIKCIGVRSDIRTGADSSTPIGFFVTSGKNLSTPQTFTPILIDLTLMFGSTIADTMTVAKFEELYLPKYYSYNAGELINNSAKAIESVGFNLWDEEWEQGSIDATTGQPVSSSNMIRPKNFIQVFAGQSYYGKSPYGLAAYFYDANKNFISGSEAGLGNQICVVPSDAAYMKFRTSSEYGTTYNNDICINLSDTSKNGTYEPYKKTITDLNLQEIRVKSPNIWDEEWENCTVDDNGDINASANYWLTKNLVPVKSNTAYYIKNNASTQIWLVNYDMGGSFLGRSQLSSSANALTFTTDRNVGFIRIFCGGSGLYTAPNNNICINVSDSAFNGRYFPHGVLTFNGLKSAGSVYDEISSDGRRLIRRVGDVDMGTLNWEKRANSNVMVSASLYGKIGNYSHIAVICGKYTAVQPVYSSTIDSLADKSVTNHDGYSSICGRDDNYTTSAAFKTAVTGVMLNYELANYETYDLVDPIPTSLPSGTTERRLPEDTADSVIAPFSADITYGVNNGDILASATPWEMIHGRPTIDKGHGTDGAWFCVNIGGQKLYIRFNTKASTETNGPGFELEISDSPDPNQQTADYTKSFTFGTLSSNDIDTICV